MKFLRPICAIALFAALSCGAQKIDPITQAVLKGYTEILDKNPKDYETLYERASQYLQLGMYPEAMTDAQNALKFTPQKNSDLRESEYSMLASASAALGDYNAALEAINNALALSPSNYLNVYKKGNILLELNRPDEAYRTFSSMQSLKSRSQEAYYGMAKACIRQGNFSEAETLMKEIETAAPTNPQTFCRLGNLFEEMNQPENAAANYIVAISMDNRGNAGLQELTNLASTNYKAVASALDFAIDKSSNKPMMLFLKGSLANRAGAYSDAETCFSRLSTLPDGNTAGVYAALAEARFAQNELPNAIEAVNKAIAIKPSADNLALKADIELAMDNTYGAIADATEAMRADANNIDAYLAAAKAYIQAGKGKEATDVLNQAVMLNPDNTLALLLRAYTNQELNNNPKAATGDFNRIILEEASSFPAITIKAIAQSKTGKKLDADDAVKNALDSNTTPEDLYWAAVYYAQTGNLDRAKELADKAVYDGYMNKHMLKSSHTPWLNLTPIAHLIK